MMPSLDNIIAAGVKPDVAAKWLAPIQVTCEKFQINTPERIAGFLSQCAHESGGFTMLEENLNYRAATLAACWPNRFAVLGPAKEGVSIRLIGFRCFDAPFSIYHLANFSSVSSGKDLGLIFVSLLGQGTPGTRVVLIISF